MVRSLFSLGSGQTQGLTYAGLRGRLLDMLGPKPITHPALSFSNNESTPEELMEEMAGGRGEPNRQQKRLWKENAEAIGCPVPDMSNGFDAQGTRQIPY